MTGGATRLYPLPARELRAEGIYEDLEVPSPGQREPTRPYVMINMVSSIDGRTAVGGTSSRLGSVTDRQTMRNLRSKADAVMIGASTLRAERLSLGLDEFSGHPLAVIVTKSGDVPIESNLITGERQEVLVIAAEDAPEPDVKRLGARASVLRLSATSSGGAISLEEALKALQATRGVDLLLVEGGPSLNYSLISQGLADELFLTVAPRLLGGLRSEAPALLEGPEFSSSGSPRSELVSIHLSDDELYLRYRFSRL